MKKYILAFCVIVCVLGAQEVTPNTSLDQPIKISTEPALAIRVVGSYFNSWNIQRIVNFLSTLPQISSAEEERTTTHIDVAANGTGCSGWDIYGEFNVFNAFWSANQDLSSFRTELTAYSSAFPQSSEVFSATASNGYTTYYDWYGKKMSTGTANNAGYDALMQENGQFVSSNLNFYAGRSTAALPETASVETRDELEITTSNGSKYTIYAYDTTTPLVLDLDGDDKLEASNGQWLPHSAHRTNTKWAEFDINGDYFDELVEWVGSNDGLLITYNANEKATGNHLFGNAKGFVQGYEQLSTFDENGDSKVAGDELKNISVWQDKNGNARVDTGEVSSVADLGITEISTNHNDLVSYFVRDGKNYMMWDWHPTMLMVKKTRK